MFAKATVIACIIGLARSGAIHNSATHLGQYGNLGAYGQHRLAGNLRYAGNPANADEAVSYVNIVREISNRGGYTNGAYPNSISGIASRGLSGYSNAAGWPNPGYAGLPYRGATGLPYPGSVVAFAGAGYPYNGNLGYSGVGFPYPHAPIYSAGSNPQAGVAAYGGVTASYSNIYNSPLRSPLLGNGAYGIGAAAGYGYGNGYGHGQAW
ncbi:pupal cuticle protein Edg-91-like isoform X1 [Plodia interpunctella]|uniref:pupal cuticle protein Edg-91-like isoform X1 n=1 Tax=Plodia interpunctella TaxID=58824 RepID=UPI002367FAF6|nr:pupal cuticle protein Edg-91-like isoform X1 [Plodia interpunctella]